MLQFLEADMSGAPTNTLHVLVLQHVPHPTPGTRRVILHLYLWLRNLKKKKTPKKTQF